MKPLRILVAEDNPDGKIILDRFLKRNGHHGTYVEDGKTCVDKALSEEFDVVLLDMNLPVLNGWQAAERIRAQKTYADLPIIAFTAFAMQGDKERCLDAGCTDYLAKPIDFSELKSLLEKYA